MSYYKEWNYGLINKLQSKENILIQSKELAVITDNFPKARFHFLILPLDENLDTIYDLTDENIDLLSEFDMLAYNIVEVIGCKKENFLYGFHIKPSMKRLHLHVVSKDFDSECLKHKKHWNSFNTDFLVTTSRIREDLLKHGRFIEPSEEIIKGYIDTPLRCNSCDYKPKHMPDLKKHLSSTHTSTYVDSKNLFLSLCKKVEKTPKS